MQIEIRPNNNIPALPVTMTFLARQLSLSLHATMTFLARAAYNLSPQGHDHTPMMSGHSRFI